MSRIRRNFLKGTIPAGLSNVATTASSVEFANIPAIGGGDHMAITLDPDGAAPEIVWITAHDAVGTTATILRAQEGTVAATHPADVAWRHAVNALDVDQATNGAPTALIVNQDEEPGRRIYVGDEEPADPEDGDLWFDDTYVGHDKVDETDFEAAMARPLHPRGVGYRPAALKDVAEGIAGATSGSPFNIAVLGDSISAVTVPTHQGHRPWPWLLEQLLTGQTLTDGVRYAKVSADTNHVGMDSTTGSYPSADLGSGDWASEMDDGEVAIHSGVYGSTMRVFWTRQPTGGDLQVRDTNGAGTLLATIDTNGTQKSSMFTDVALPGGWLLAPGIVWIGAVCGGGETSILEKIHTGYGGAVRVYPAVHAGYSSSTYTTTPAVGLDLIENLDPDLTIIMTGTNDAPDNIGVRMAALITAVKARTTGDIMVLAPAASLTMTAAEVAILEAIAVAEEVIFLDSTAAGYSTGDYLHPDRLGHLSIARFVAAQITGDPIGFLLRALRDTTYANDQYVRDFPFTKTADYTLVQADVGRLIVHNSASPHTFTVNQQTTTPWLDGSSFRLVNQGLGALNLVGAGSAVVTGITSLGFGEEVIVRRLASNVWLSTEAANSDIDVQVFTATGDSTWTKPSWAKPSSKVMIYIHAAGGGGGGGRRDATSTLRFGGGGGGSGGTSYGEFAAGSLPATLVATVGSGGTAGAAAGSTANGGAGGAGGGSRVGLTNSTSTAVLGCTGGNGGGGGTNAAGTAGSGGNGTFQGGAGAAATAAGAAGTNGPGTNRTGGGGSGGGITAANATSAGGNGNVPLSRAVASGAAGGAAGANGANGVAPPYGGYFADESGGAGGGSSNTVASGNGGVGGVGGGGGGGGAGINGQTGGAGGAGGPGRVIIVTIR